ncbi:MAG: hypothetical protein Q7R40_10715 [Phaeospirillum sp.]|nr:hypothetical protein [Phaeospirillum sp.]
MSLTVTRYNEGEALAMEAQPNRITEACRPELFLKAGYPVEVKTEAGLIRFADVMHENRDPIDYKDLLHGFTAEEFDLFKEVTAKVGEFTESRFGRKVLPKGALTRAMLSYRHIRWLAEPGSAVFEIGPGSGYLGALLATAGYRYGASDITQGFYLYQSHLWEYMFGDRLIELAGNDLAFTGTGDLPSGAVLHVPWWKYTVVQPEAVTTPIDVFIANHALCEMNLYSMCYTIKLSRQMLSASEKYGYFFIEGTGGEMLRSRAATFHYFDQNKFTQVFEDGGLIDVLVPEERASRLFLPKEEASAGVPASQPAPQNTAAKIRRRVGVIRGKIANHGGVIPVAIKVARRLLSKTSTQPNLVELLHAVNTQAEAPRPDETVVHRQITDGRAWAARQPKVEFEDVRKFQRALMPNGDVRSDDERFFQYVFGTSFYS